MELIIVCDWTKYAILSAAVAMLVGCSGNLQQLLEDTLPSKDSQYKSSRRLPPLEIPPDLSSESIRESLVVPSSGEVTASELQRTQSGDGRQVVASAVLPKQDDIRLERNGDKRWLVINAKPEQVWPKMREFWIENGFLIKLEDPSIGIMETDWAENRLDVPRGIIESMLSRISDSLYSGATRDKFRARLERGSEDGTTELYVSHRGARENRSDALAQPTSLADSTGNYKWEPRPADPELEAEMLARMMAYFGVSREIADERVAETRERAPRAHLVKDDTGSSVLAMREDFSRAWRRTGLALDRVGFTVEDRDRSRGLYFVRYVDPSSEGLADSGFLSSLKFWGEDEKPAETEYLISLVGGDSSTQVVVLDKRGERDHGRTAARILGLLHDQLK